MNLVVEEEIIKGECRACPFYGNLDNSHKIAVYMVKSRKLHVRKKGQNKKENDIEKKEKQTKTLNHTDLPLNSELLCSILKAIQKVF